MKKTRIQERGECCFCGKEHAVKNSTFVVNHGYVVQWGGFMNTCYGANVVHYGHSDAPKEIAKVIASLENYLSNDLPQLLATAKAEYQEVKARRDNATGYNGVLEKEFSVAMKKWEGLVREFENQIPESISYFKERKDNWVECDTREVDLEVEEAEARKARQVEAEAKKAAKLAEKEAKAKAQAEREHKADVKAMALWEALGADNHYRLFYQGQLIESWVAAVGSEDAIYDMWKTKVRDHFAKVNGGALHGSEIGEFYLDVRNQPEGKGKRLFEIVVHGTAKAYFARWAD